MSWLFQFGLFSSFLPDPSVDMDAWYTYVVASPHAFRNLVKRAVKLSVSSLEDITLPSYKKKSSDDTQPSLSYMCDLCDKSYNTMKDLACHKAGKHLVKQPLRNKIAQTFCLCCGRDYHTRYKIVSHVAYNSAVCRNYYIMCVPDNPVELTSTLDAEESKHAADLRKRGFRPSYHHIPPTSLHFARPFNPGVDEAEDE